jgi:hypothetical protein
MGYAGCFAVSRARPRLDCIYTSLARSLARSATSASSCPETLLAAHHPALARLGLPRVRPLGPSACVLRPPALGAPARRPPQPGVARAAPSLAAGGAGAAGRPPLRPRPAGPAPLSGREGHPPARRAPRARPTPRPRTARRTAAPSASLSSGCSRRPAQRLTPARSLALSLPTPLSWASRNAPGPPQHTSTRDVGTPDPRPSSRCRLGERAGSSASPALPPCRRRPARRRASGPTPAPASGTRTTRPAPASARGRARALPAGPSAQRGIGE